MSKTAEMYDLSETLDLAPLSSLPPGSTLLLSGGSGTRALVQSVLVDGIRDGQGAIPVSTDRSGSDWIDEIAAATDGFPGYTVGAIDCQARDDRESTQLANGALQYSVTDPTDLTGIGIGITKCLSRFDDRAVTEARLGLSSLSTILAESDRKTTFKFCHVLASRLQSAGFVGVFAIDSTAHEDRTLQVVKQAFDGEIELRDNGGTREARVRGLAGKKTSWTPV